MGRITGAIIALLVMGFTLAGCGSNDATVTGTAARHSEIMSGPPTPTPAPYESVAAFSTSSNKLVKTVEPNKTTGQFTLSLPAGKYQIGGIAYPNSTAKSRGTAVPCGTATVTLTANHRTDVGQLPTCPAF
jgi:hypothetical protein